MVKRFDYEAVNRRGERQIGYIEAASRQAAIKTLKNYELHLLKLRPQQRSFLIYLNGFLELIIWLMIGGLIVKVAAPIIL